MTLSRLFVCIGFGLLVGFPAALALTTGIGFYYAEELATLVPNSVTTVALKAADKIQGYE